MNSRPSGGRVPARHIRWRAKRHGPPGRVSGAAIAVDPLSGDNLDEDLDDPVPYEDER